MTNSDRRFIEESFPVKEVGEASAREKSIRHGHISTLHIWWARRPLAASRATAYTALTPYPDTEEEREKKKQFIIDLCQWENSNNPALLERARREILKANGGVPPRVLDPFSGGGSYPLEALRLGCISYANDYNPVAVLIEKATLEYPQKFGRPFEGMPEWAYPPKREESETSSKKNGKGKDIQSNFFDQTPIDNQRSFNPLLNAVRYWGEWVLEEARKELAEFYPPDPDGSIPVGYIWARTIPCQNPACGTEIPLMRQFWLTKKDNKKVSLYPDVSTGKITFSIVGDGYEYWPTDFNPENGSVSKAVVTCPLCGSITDNLTTRHLILNGKGGQFLVVKVLPSKRGEGKSYKIASDQDREVYKKIQGFLSQKRSNWINQFGFDPVPDEQITKERPSPNARGTSGVTRYGLENWGQLFNSRQQLVLITFIEKIRKAYQSISGMGSHQEFAISVCVYLALTFDRMAASNNGLCRWQPTGEKIADLFSRQALSMVWDYAEPNQINGTSRSWAELFTDTINVLEHLSLIPNQNAFGGITQSSATQLPYQDNYFDAILTDPPYYDNVPYSQLSDFFYVWLKRALSDVLPDLFSTPLVPKNNEIVAYTLPDGGFEAGKKFFEDNLKKAFQEMHRTLKPEGVAAIVYAHKSTEGWETVINALLDSGLVVTSAWPLNTEMKSRVNANETASLASSIYIVARKMPRQPTGFYNEVRTELRKHLDNKLHRLWEEGIGGADFFIAAIGSAIEVFGKYEQVMDYEGNIVRADRLLEEVRTIATDYAVRQILHNGFAAEISGLTRLYVLWRWNYGEALVPFDEARKLGQSCGIDISQAWSKTGFIRKEKDFVRLLGPQNRKLDDLDDPRDLVDVLHKTLLLWEKSQRAELILTLAEKGHGKSDAFYRVAQAISETLPLESKEKKLLDGFLAGRERVQEEVEKAAEQGRLFE